MEYLVILIIAVAVGAGLYFLLSKKEEKSKESASPQPEKEEISPVGPQTTQAPAEEKKQEIQSVRQPTQDEIDNTQLVIEARSRAKELVVEAKSQALKIKSDADEEARKIKDKVSEVEKNLVSQKAHLEAREKELENTARTLKNAKEVIEKKQEEVDSMYKEQKTALEKVASMTRDEARNMLLQSFDKELNEEKGKRVKQIEEDIKRRSDEIAQGILVEAMRFGATDFVAEYTTSKVKLPDEEMKGRIIGKEGRNIRAFEEITGVDLDLDSSPGEVIVSCFDPVRREIAKVSLEKLLSDGRIQPAKIEEIVHKTTKEIEHLMFKAGDDLCHKVGAYNVPKELMEMLGRFKYRFSYGQNMIEHTLEETRIGMAIAHELGANVETVKLGCLFHDIGKVVTDDEGTHVDLGVDLLKKHKMSEDIINCVAEHHEDKPFSSVESAIVNLADHISGARPGARSEDYEAYVERLKNLEEAAMSFDGVDKAHAVSAGREVRVFVTPEIVDDASTSLLAREIARKIELEQSYPGVVKVIVIRETRAQETAK